MSCEQTEKLVTLIAFLLAPFLERFSLNLQRDLKSHQAPSRASDLVLGLSNGFKMKFPYIGSKLDRFQFLAI